MPWVDDTQPSLHEREEHWPGGQLRARWTVRIDHTGAELRHGLYESWHANGLRSERGFFADGAQAEIWTRWDDTGRQTFSGYMQDTGGEAAPEPDPAAWDEPLDTSDAADAASPRSGWMLECGVVLALAWLAPMAYGLLSEGAFVPASEWVTVTSEDDWEFVWMELPRLAASLQILLPLLYVIWRSDLAWSDVWITPPRWSALLFFGPLLAMASLGVDAVLVRVLDAPQPPGYYAVPVSIAPWVLLVVSMLANSLAEEFVWRGYMLKRLTQLGGSPVFALLVSTALFASYHVYQGPLNAGLVFVTGLIWGVSVLVLKRIWPAVVAHTIHNIVLFTPLADELFPAAAA